jgi:Anti-sigma-K factor rskA
MTHDDDLGEFLGRRPDEDADLELPAAAARVRELLGSPAAWDEPDPGTLDAVLSRIAAERDSVAPDVGRPGAPGPTTSAPATLEPEAAVPEAAAPETAERQAAAQAAPAPVAVPTTPAPAYRARRRWFALAAGVALLGGGAAGGWFAQDQFNNRGEVVTLAGTELAPDASAVARVRDTASGVRIALDVSDLAPAEPGTFYAAWLRSDDGDLVPIGTFHVREGTDTVELWAGVELENYPLITVTLQQEGAGEASSGQVVLRGEIAG